MDIQTLKGAKLCDLQEAYALGVITARQLEELEPTAIHPRRDKPWHSYMRREWREDYAE